jgi:peptidoglycan-N-acetylglucosamine deacetylase
VTAQCVVVYSAGDVARGLRFAVAFLVAIVLGAAANPVGAASDATKSPARVAVVDARGDANFDLTRLAIDQNGPLLAVRIAGPSLRAAALTASHPLCLTFSWGGRDRRRACLRRSTAGTVRLVSSNLVSHAVVATIPVVSWAPGRVEFDLDSSELGLSRSGSVVVGGADACHGCEDRIPDWGSAKLALAPWQITGCTAGTPSLRLVGSGSDAVALTFDDGPAPETGAVLRVLSRYGAHATFFQIGVQVPGRDAIERRILDAGDGLGDHSWRHESLPSEASMASTQAAITRASGFRPCVFRPPGGTRDARLIADASALSMDTIIWDVDPQDWTRPGAGAIERRVLAQVHAGSVILMHDGGGDRSETLAALPTIITVLERRGFRLVTVESLLGFRPVYRYG